MDSPRRPPHYYGLPSRAPRRHKSPPPSPSATTKNPPVGKPSVGTPQTGSRLVPASQRPVADERPGATIQDSAVRPVTHGHHRHHHRSRLEPAREYYAAHAHTPPQIHDDDMYAATHASQRQKRIRHEPGTLQPGPGALGPDAQPVVHRRRRIKKARRLPTTPMWKRIRRVALVLCGVLIAEMAMAATTAPQFGISEVDTPSDLKITPQGEVQSLVGPLVGQNVFRVKSRPAVQALEHLPTVRKANIKRVLSWPPRLAVQVQERQPFARITAGKAWFVADRDGVPFRRAEPGDAGLYAIAAPEFAPQLGRPVPTKLWQSVLQFVTELQQRDVRWKLQRVEFDKIGSAALTLRNAEKAGLLVLLGADRWADKLARTGQALDYFAAGGLDPKMLDLRVYERPVWRPRHPEPEAPALPGATPAGPTVNGSSTTKKPEGPSERDAIGDGDDATGTSQPLDLPPVRKAGRDTSNAAATASRPGRVTSDSSTRITPATDESGTAPRD